MFGIGGFELFIILLFGFLLFGPDKLPEMARTLGAALRKFQKAQQEMEAVIKDEVLQENEPKAAPASAQRKKPAPNTSQESFAERKARFDAQRAERKKQEREELEAKRREVKEQAANKETAGSVPDSAAGEDSSQETTAAQAAQAAHDAAAKGLSAGESSSQDTPALTPEELFGTKPIAPLKQTAQSTQSTSASKEGE